MMELTTEDRERIEQEAKKYVRLMNWGYHKEAKDDFIKGAEYATKYERDQQAELYSIELEKLRRNIGYLMNWISKEHPQDALRLMDEIAQQNFINSPENQNRDNMIIGFKLP